MATFNILVLPGDGIGPEVTGAAQRVLDAVAKRAPLREKAGERVPSLRREPLIAPVGAVG
jgi:isocitrate/isopropylmalate dehydrogenase